MKKLNLSRAEWSVYLIAALLIFVAPIFVSFNPLSGIPPQITQTTLDNKKIVAPKFIYFWASWCKTCKGMQAPISAVLKDYSGVTVAVKSGMATKVQDYLTKQQLNWSTVNDENGVIAKQYSVTAVPTIFILNSEDEIAFVTQGYVGESALRFRLWFASL
ncbi:MAG: thioredoxin fold domain-containing protein [Methylococcaceae bacterium]|nr:thioredoxin fold domain-containing protein [Methylococcaceae bacterium]